MLTKKQEREIYLLKQNYGFEHTDVSHEDVWQYQCQLGEVTLGAEYSVNGNEYFVITEDREGEMRGGTVTLGQLIQQWEILNNE